MASYRLSVYLFLLFIHSVPLSLAQLQLQYHDCYKNNGKYVTNSTYHANLNRLLNTLTVNTSRYGFYNLSFGQNPDKVFATALCRPDMEPDSCSNCIDLARKNMTPTCPNYVMGIAGYDDRGDNNCMLRYANYDIFGLMENAPYFFVYAPSNISEDILEVFNQTRERLLNRIINEAAARSSPNKYATGEEAYSTIGSIYGLVQCTPDLSATDCKKCLNDTTKLMSQCCDRRQGGRVINPSCSFRYETNKFFKQSIEGPIGSPEPTPSPPNTITSRGKKNHTVIIIVVILVVTFMVLIICVGVFLRLRNSSKENKTHLFCKDTEDIISAESLQFDFSTIRVATDDFSDANKLGQGGFGSVYKGMLSNGEQIAVKRLSKNSNQGDLEFKNEVVLVARLQHRNLARLLGFCLERKERILVYEFVPNASLDLFIFNPINRENLNWETRYKIVEGVARGLLYLHEDSRFRIIHRDLKASNVLLDSDMNPKISDFGMARLFEMDQTHSDTNRVVGTFGYMAPEYVMHGRYSVKSDIFSFGVLVLEIVSGQKRSSFGNEEETEDLLTYAWRNWNEGTALNLIDPKISSGPTSEMMKFIFIGLLCVQEGVSDRPSMASVVNMLNSETITLVAPSKPGFFMKSLVIPETSSSQEHNSASTELDEHRNGTLQLSKNEASISELTPR
ncbi:Cysteine rich receptor like kinase [Melia azedarach]|uniref:Cysteine rich receptor like kinase n=1 Tax=Melia azedarach TaxID=155640 RepID=A0ACC1WY58_MELAZ|nr:Cysteine rich receptor like kinase [Melia azedarach]